MATLCSFRVLSSSLSCALALALSGCGGGQSFEKSLDEMWQWDGGAEASRVVTALEKAEAKEKVPAAVGVTGRGLVGRTLPDGQRWTYEGGVDVLPTLAGDLVIFTGEGKVIALDVRTGKKRYEVDVNGRRLEGAGFDGKYSILLLVDKDDAREDQILVLSSTGEEVFSAKANARMGTPAAIDGVGLVPYSGQYVAGLDIESGKLLGRLLVRDGLHTVSSEPKGVVLYGAGATLLDENLTSSPDSQSLKLKPRKLPGEPSWPIDGSKPRPPRARPVGIYAHVAPSEGGLRLSSGGYVATYYEVALGLEKGSNDIRFSTHFPRAVAGGAAGKYGPTLCLDSGAIVRLNSKTGHHIPYGALESKVKGCVVTAPDDKIPSGDRPAVLEQLEETIASTGPDMVAIQKVLLRELGSTDNQATTSSLLAISQNPLVSLDLARAADKLLAKRRKGGQVMIEALLAGAPKPLEASPEKPADPAAPDGPKNEEPARQETPEEEAERLLKEASEPIAAPDGESAIDPNARRREKLRPPPVGAIAQALVRMKTKGAAEALAPYLNDPSLSAKAALNLMKAISKLGTGSPEEIEQVSRFLYQYKNTGGEPVLLDALVLAVHFLYQHGDEAADEKLQQDLSQSLTHPDLTKKLKKSPPPRDNKKPKAADDKKTKDATDDKKARTPKK